MTTNPSRIEWFDNPNSIPIERVLTARQVTTLLAGGIVNPFGPTLTAVVAIGSLEADSRLPVVHLVLNPFSQSAEIVGELIVDQVWTPHEVIPAVFHLPFGSCPTHLSSSMHLNHSDRLLLHAQFLSRFENARGVLSRIRQYFGNPMERVSHELTTLAEDSAEPLNDAEASELAELLTSEQHWKEELAAFFYTWKSSIDFQREHGNSALADAAMSLEAVKILFLKIARTCSS